MEPIVEITGLDKFYGDLHILKNVALSVTRGEVLVIIAVRDGLPGGTSVARMGDKLRRDREALKSFVLHPGPSPSRSRATRRRPRAGYHANRIAGNSERSCVQVWPS